MAGSGPTFSTNNNSDPLTHHLLCELFCVTSAVTKALKTEPAAHCDLMNVTDGWCTEFYIAEETVFNIDCIYHRWYPISLIKVSIGVDTGLWYENSHHSSAILESFCNYIITTVSVLMLHGMSTVGSLFHTHTFSPLAASKCRRYRMIHTRDAHTHNMNISVFLSYA